MPGYPEARSPTSPSELAALKPSHVFIGHGHFDHTADAGPIAAASGAVVVGTATHCPQIAQQALSPIQTKVLPITAEGDVAHGDSSPLHLSRTSRQS